MTFDNDQDKILFLATNIFAKGGIQRYTRAQIQALRELVGETSVKTLVLHPPLEDQFEEPFTVDYIGHGLSWRGRLDFIAHSILDGIHEQPTLIWTNHIALLPLAKTVSLISSGNTQTIVNVYGLEMWSGISTFKRRALQSATHIVSDCRFTATYVQQTFAVPKSRISVNWDPVNVNKFTPLNNARETLIRYGVPYRPDACYLMTLGRISEKSRHKGYDRILDIMGQLERDDIIYLIVGDGDDRERLERRTRDEGLVERVVFLGSIPENDLVNVYNAADIFVLVSDQAYGRGEGVPLTPLEASACGKPIIVGNEDGSPEAVNHGENGYVVSPRDLNAIRQAILQLVDDVSLRQEMGKAARQRVEKDFSYQAFKARTANILKQIKN